MKKQWNKLVAACACALVASVLVAADTPRAEWLGKVGDCANNAATMAATMSSVSAADQAALVAEVNAALAKMPGSNEQRAAAFVKADVAAVKAAMLQNKEKHAANKVIAEVFATVPPEYLPVVSEQLSKQVLKRNGLPKETYVTISTNVLHAVTERCSTAENGSVREAFAAVMFLQAAGEAPTKEMIDVMLSQMGDAKARETAKNEWVGPALGLNGATKSYDPMLGAANAGDEPDRAVVASILAGTPTAATKAPAEVAKTETKVEATEADDRPLLPNAAGAVLSGSFGVALLGELQAMNSSMDKRMGLIGTAGSSIPGAIVDIDGDLASGIGLYRTPRAYVESKKAVGGDKDGRASDSEDGNPYHTSGRGSKAGDGDSGHWVRYYGECWCYEGQWLLGY